MLLKDDFGYTGFRYDMVKGFSGSLHVSTIMLPSVNTL